MKKARPATRRLVTFEVSFTPRLVREPWLVKLATTHGLEYIGAGERDLAFQARKGLRGVEDLRAFAEQLRQRKGIRRVTVRVKKGKQ